MFVCVCVADDTLTHRAAHTTLPCLHGHLWVHSAAHVVAPHQDNPCLLALLPPLPHHPLQVCATVTTFTTTFPNPVCSNIRKIQAKLFSLLTKWFVPK